MTAIEGMLQQPLAHAIGWALLQFVWQGTLIGLMAALLLAALRRSAADVRYVVSTIALSLMVTIPVVTAVQSFERGSIGSRAGVAALAMIDDADRTTTRRGAQARRDRGPAPLGPRAQATTPSSAYEHWLPVFVGVWLAGVAILTLRLFSGWVWVQRMRTRGAAPVSPPLQLVAEQLLRRLHISRSVRFLQSTIVDVPTVIGWIKPVVLLPTSALAGLSPVQLEAILAHELAHIRRHDYLVNLMQTVVETLLFYHPAVWWLSRRIRIERENCCDDLAVSLCGDPVTYASALAELEERRRGGHGLVLAATGGSLLQRVKRLLGAPSHAGRAPGWLAAGIAVLMIVVVSIGALAPDRVRAEASKTRASRGGRASAQRPLPPAALEATSAPRPFHEAVVDVRQLAEDASELARAVKNQTVEIADIARDAAELIHRAHFESKHIPELAESLKDVAVETEAALARELARVTEIDRVPDIVEKKLARVTEAAIAEVHRALKAVEFPPLPEPVALRSERQQGRSTMSWSKNGERLSIEYRGDIEFTDDDTDVRRVSPGGYLRIREGGRFFSDHTIEIEARADGSLERRYWAGRSERPFVPEGREWLARFLPGFIRQSGIGAPARVARILKARGFSGVLAEITLIEGSWAKRVYFNELLQRPLDAKALEQVFAQAGREIDSDFELASLLTSASHLLTDDGARRAYFDASRSIDSDFEMRRVFSAANKKGPVSPAVLTGILETAVSIDSDFELASLLADVVKQQPIDNASRIAFFKALSTVSSDFEHRRVLTTLFKRTDLSDEVLGTALDNALRVNSDFEAASVLIDFLGTHSIEGAVRGPFFARVDAIKSSFERGRVLQAVVKRGDVSQDTVLSVIRSAQTMHGGFEKSQVLMAVAKTHQLTAQGRDAYLDAADALGDFEQGQVLSALLKSERRR